VNLNKVFLAGTLADPVRAKATQSGHTLARFTVVVRDRYDDRESCQYIHCVAWNRFAEMVDGCTQGMIVLVEGQLQYNAWTGNDGQKKERYEVRVQHVQLHAAPPTVPGPGRVAVPAGNDADDSPF
jgi:single stranded DNA-binding protein